MNTTLRSERGVSLIEALVAMAVMAFGMLAILGLQSALRGSSDISKQRTEAVRFAQQTMEEKRRFSVLESLAGSRAFAEIAAEASAPIAIEGYGSSTTFSRVLTVSEQPLLSATPTEQELYYMPRRKQLAVEVSWQDRNGEAQLMRLDTIIARVSPEVVGALSVAGMRSIVQDPFGRNRNVPPGAIDLPSEPGKSIFNPPGLTPGAEGSFWKFDNATGRIVALCNDISGSGASLVAVDCTGFNGYLLSGYIRYAVGSGAPGSSQSEAPPDLVLPVSGVTVGVVVHNPAYSDDAEATPSRCYVDSPASSFGAYFCAVAVDTISGTWNGRSTVTFNNCWSRVTRHDGFPPALPMDPVHPYRCVSADANLFADSITDNNSARFRVCRYTTRRDQSAVTDGPPPFRNIEHPLDYLGVRESLSNQNFLVIRAGSGSEAYECPGDDSGTPVNGSTWHHQPAPPVI